jgi:hypothetical protein
MAAETMSNQWFRLYSKIMTDPKIEMLSFEDQRHFVWILCMKNDGYLDEKFQDKEMFDRMISRKLGLQGEAFEMAKKRLVSVGLIDEKWQPLQWEKSQFASDHDRTSAERKRRQRAKNSNKEQYVENVTRDVTDEVTNVSRQCHYARTEQNRTDTEQKEKEKEITNVISKKKKVDNFFGCSVEDMLHEFGIAPQLAHDWIVHRKSKKAPITRTAMKRMETEAKKGGISLEEAIETAIDRHWISYQSSWDSGNKIQNSYKSEWDGVPVL